MLFFFESNEKKKQQQQQQTSKQKQKQKKKKTLWESGFQILQYKSSIYLFFGCHFETLIFFRCKYLRYKFRTEISLRKYSKMIGSKGTPLSTDGNEKYPL